MREDLSNRKPRVVSLFSGCGGMDLGFISAGFEVIWANDFDRWACETYGRNIGDHIVEGDIRSLDLSQLPAADAVIGGFPCVDFSGLGKRAGIHGESGELYRYMIDAIKFTQPKMFVAENVPRLRSSVGGAEIINAFRELPYILHDVVVNFSHYGVAQHRKRLLLIGVRFDWMLPFPTTPKPVTVSEALRGVEDCIFNNVVRELSPVATKVMPYIAQGDSIQSTFAEHPEFRTHGTFRNMFRRVHPHKPSHAITCGGNRAGGGRRTYHWKEDRALTDRELARLFGYPDDFEFIGSTTRVLSQIGNSVPPVGIKPIATSLREAMMGEQLVYALHGAIPQ